MEITPALHVKNEEYWIHYVLRDLFRVFDAVVMLDTGSTDRTVDIARATVHQVGGALNLMVEDMENDVNSIGDAPNILRSIVQTEWMLLVDGDEIWGRPQLEALKNIEPEDDKLVGMCNGRNLMVVDGVLKEREGFSADRLFRRGVVWDKRGDYPFQSHGLEGKASLGQVFHTNFDISYFWHVRHLMRSSKDGEASYRIVKKDYFPNPALCRELPADWLTDVSPDYPNPYLGVEG